MSGVVAESEVAVEYSVGRGAEISEERNLVRRLYVLGTLFMCIVHSFPRPWSV